MVVPTSTRSFVPTSPTFLQSIHLLACFAISTPSMRTRIISPCSGRPRSKATWIRLKPLLTCPSTAIRVWPPLASHSYCCICWISKSAKGSFASSSYKGYASIRGWRPLHLYQRERPSSSILSLIQNKTISKHQISGRPSFPPSFVPGPHSLKMIFIPVKISHISTSR